MVSEPQGQQENEEGNKRMDRHMGWLLCVVLACRVLLVDEARSNGPKVWVSDQLTASESWTERGGMTTVSLELNGVKGVRFYRTMADAMQGTRFLQSLILLYGQYWGVVGFGHCFVMHANRKRILWRMEAGTPELQSNRNEKPYLWFPPTVSTMIYNRCDQFNWYWISRVAARDRVSGELISPKKCKLLYMLMKENIERQYEVIQRDFVGAGNDAFAKTPKFRTWTKSCAIWIVPLIEASKQTVAE